MAESTSAATHPTQVSFGSHSPATRRTVRFTSPHLVFTRLGTRRRSTSRAPASSSSSGSAAPASSDPTSIARTSRASAVAESRPAASSQRASSSGVATPQRSLAFVQPSRPVVSAASMAGSFASSASTCARSWSSRADSPGRSRA
jgi:hypothetical protein